MATSTYWYDCRIIKAEQICIAARLKAAIHFKAEERPETGAALAALAERMGKQPGPHWQVLAKVLTSLAKDWQDADERIKRLELLREKARVRNGWG